MIILKKNKYLAFKNLKFRCAIGKNGIKKKIKEGDFVTPKGTFALKKVYYREDRIKNLKTKLKKIKIKKFMAWCDDPKSKFYNKQIKLPSRYSYEKLYRNDKIYDIIITLDYNTNPIIKNKGSAIFIHISKRNYKPTAGCIALKKENLMNLLSVIKQDNKIKII
jgi:L,D-peptidoglycan transpeptidase YkuD (ErfK/YbiS/YcfS/YnhG family)